MVNGFRGKEVKKQRSKVIKTLCILTFIHLCIFTFFFTQNSVFAKKVKVLTPQQQYKHQQNVLREEVKEKYERSLLPESGYMTREEYEELSKDIPNSEKVIPPYKLPRNTKMKYIPQPTYKLVHYNNPPGSPELHIPLRFKFDRQINCQGIVSPNKDIMVYPVVYYYANNQCTAGDLFVIPLDTKFLYVERVKRANVVKRISTPILSTPKEIREKFIFRTLTPIDFSPDGTKLIAKEKIGNVNDGIWKTNLWVYDFITSQSKNLSEIRDAIRFYWGNTENLILDDKRWDIEPLGFDADNPDRIIVSAYGYTGTTPKFLGNWSIDCNGEQSRLISLFSAKSNIDVSGLKLVQDGVIEPSLVYENEKQEDKSAKKDHKKAKKTKKKELNSKKKALKNTLKEMKKEENKTLKEYNKRYGEKGITGID